MPTLEKVLAKNEGISALHVWSSMKIRSGRGREAEEYIAAVATAT
jgi:hypothetical protein